jgi:hypothetical protein
MRHWGEERATPAAAAAEAAADTALEGAGAAAEPLFPRLDAGAAVREHVFDFARPSDWVTKEDPPPGLTVTLFAYQLRALAWMRWRESLAAGAARAAADAASGKARLPRASERWPPAALPSGAVVYYNAGLGAVARAPRPADPPAPSGVSALLFCF